MDTLSDHIGFPKVFNDVFRDKSSDIVEKKRRRRRHTCAIFQVCCVDIGQASTVFLHVAVKIDELTPC